MLYKGVDEDFWLHVLPEGVVALDVDSYTSEYYADGELRDLFLSKVWNLAVHTSDYWDLGRFWIVQTYSGAHVIFENFCIAWEEVLRWASTQDPWHSCLGHFVICKARQACVLRVSCKGNRPFDLEPFRWASDYPAHVANHLIYTMAFKEESNATQSV